MESDELPPVTELLHAARRSQPGAEDKLIRAVYGELRKLARSKLRGERVDETLQDTALVHEAYLRLFDKNIGDFNNRVHFFGAAAETMRRILIDRARRAKAAKRGGDAARADLDANELSAPQNSVDLLSLNDALDALAEVDERAAEVVKLRFFVGLSIEEVADALGIAPRTVRGDWTYAKKWLRVRLADGDSTQGKTK